MTSVTWGMVPRRSVGGHFGLFVGESSEKQYSFMSILAIQFCARRVMALTQIVRRGQNCGLCYFQIYGFVSVQEDIVCFGTFSVVNGLNN